VEAVMVEVNRDLYLDPVSFEPKADFNRTAAEIKTCCVAALHAYAAVPTQ
jgi:N-formylglutamate amidohydrolase